MKLSALIFAAALAGCATSSLPATQRIDSGSLHARIEALMAREQVVGMAVAVVDHGEITHLNASGVRNREDALPLQTDTIMYGASVTKAAFAYMVLQLVGCVFKGFRANGKFSGSQGCCKQGNHCGRRRGI